MKISQKGILQGRGQKIEYLVITGVTGKTKIKTIEKKYRGTYNHIAGKDIITRPANRG